jgi:hypothetical protein
MIHVKNRKIKKNGGWLWHYRLVLFEIIPCLIVH